MTIKKLFLALAGAAAVAGGPGSAAAADSVADFYRHKTVTIILGTSLGASFGRYARLLSEHIGKHIPGNPTVILTSRPGGGGVVAAGYVDHAAPRDGTVISQPVPAAVTEPLFREVKYDPRGWAWLGAQAPLPSVITVWHNSPAKSLAEARETELVMGATGRGSDTFTAPRLANALLGTRFKIVTSYKGGAQINLAMESGEVHGRKVVWNGWVSSKPDWLRDGKIIHLLQYGPPIAALPDVPRFRDLVKAEEDRLAVDLLSVPTEIGVAYYVHPDVPKARTEALRRAFAATHKDPLYLAEAKKRKSEIDYVPSERQAALTAAAFGTPPEVLDRLKQIYK